MLGKRDLHHETREGIDYYLSPFLGEFVRKFWLCDWSAKKFAAKKLDQPTLLLVASREQIRPVENVILVIVILLPVKYLLKLSGPVIFTDYV